jgi:hemerythrin-like domain-containing protein
MAYVQRMDDLDLDTRTGLPDALRVLLERYPRAGWEAHPRYDGLTRFWLERHLMFRRLQAGLDETTQGFLTGNVEATRAAQTIGRLGNLYLNELHGHHSIEDAHYFPALARLEPRLEAGFALLDRDHHRLDAELHAFAEAANAALRALGDPKAARDAMGRLDGVLTGFGAFLDRHLVDEEEIIVPVILDNPGAGLG